MKYSNINSNAKEVSISPEKVMDGFIDSSNVIRVGKYIWDNRELGQERLLLEIKKQGITFEDKSGRTFIYYLFALLNSSNVEETKFILNFVLDNDLIEKSIKQHSANMLCCITPQSLELLGEEVLGKFINKCDVNARSEVLNCNPIYYHYAMSSEKIFNLFLKFGAELNTRDKHGNTLAHLHIAAIAEFYEGFEKSFYYGSPNVEYEILENSLMLLEKNLFTLYSSMLKITNNQGLTLKDCAELVIASIGGKTQGEQICLTLRALIERQELEAGLEVELTLVAEQSEVSENQTNLHGPKKSMQLKNKTNKV